MPQPTLAERVAALERAVAELKAAWANGAHQKDWHSTLGMFTGDETVREAFKEAMKLREADRRRTRPRQVKKQQPKS